MNTSAQNISSAYTPSDATDRHHFAVQKNRKQASTGGGRAWSEDEEVYLLQTRLQKMPYKHIAAHLKKTELACRLHYHQLSHGSNRRKRTTSVSSGSSTLSPMMHVSRVQSPIHESNSIPGSPESYTYSPETQQVQLPSAASLLPRSGSSSPQRTLGHPIAILPKPTLPRQVSSTPPLRLDCAIPVSSHGSTSIDQKRLAYIYESHRAAFWGAVAAEYGHGTSPAALEDAWRYGNGTGSGSSSFNVNAPPTPCVSPDGGNVYQREEKTSGMESRPNATSISALLGIDASPTSPQERELIKRIEEGRSEIV